MDDKKLKALEGMSLFQLLTPQEIEDISHICCEKTFPTGTKIFMENDEGQSMYVINSGTIKITKRIEGIEREVITLYAGDFFGEIALFEQVSRTGTAVALEDVSLFEIRRDDFSSFISSNSYTGLKILYYIIKDMGKRLRRMDVLSENLFI